MKIPGQRSFNSFVITSHRLVPGGGLVRFLKNLFVAQIIAFIFISCNQSGQTKDNSKSEIALKNHQLSMNYLIKNKALLDSLYSFDKLLKENFQSDFIIALDFRLKTDSDSIVVLLSEIINKSEIVDRYPSYIAYTNETPVFLFTGYEELLSMPQAFRNMVDSLTDKKLNKSITEEMGIVPPITYTPIIVKFLLLP